MGLLSQYLSDVLGIIYDAVLSWFNVRKHTDTHTPKHAVPHSHMYRPHKSKHTHTHSHTHTVTSDTHPMHAAHFLQHQVAVFTYVWHVKVLLLVFRALHGLAPTSISSLLHLYFILTLPLRSSIKLLLFGPHMCLQWWFSVIFWYHQVIGMVCKSIYGSIKRYCFLDLILWLTCAL